MRLVLKEKIQKLIPSTTFPLSINYILIGILILGFFIRVYKISSLPLYGDELTIGLDSYSLLKTGKDQTGERFPLTFKMGVGRPAGYVYASIPFVAVFGPNEWGVRGLSIVSSVGIIILMYFLGKKLFNQKVGLIASFLTSISIWDIYLARGGFEAHFALFLALFGVVMFIYEKWVAMAIFFGFTIFTYPTFKLTLPLLLSILILFKGIRETFKNKSFVVALIILMIFGLISLKETSKGVSEERFVRLNVLSDIKLNQEMVQKINEERNLSSLPEFIKPFIYNKPLKYTRFMFETYLENLSPNFLYLRGDRNPRHNPGEWGMLYLVELPLLFLGLYYLAKDNSKTFSLLIPWILIVPLATMFLGQTHGLRNNLMLPPLTLISAYAISKLSIKISTVFVALMVVQLVGVLMTIYFYAPNKFGSFWSEEAKKVSLQAIKESKAQEVILSTKIDNIEYAYPVYAKIDPKEVIAQYGHLPKIYGNVIITDLIPAQVDDSKTMVIEKGDNLFGN